MFVFGPSVSQWQHTFCLYLFSHVPNDHNDLLCGIYIISDTIAEVFHCVNKKRHHSVLFNARIVQFNGSKNQRFCSTVLLSCIVSKSPCAVLCRYVTFLTFHRLFPDLHLSPVLSLSTAYLTHSYLLKYEDPLICIPCSSLLTVGRILIHAISLTSSGMIYPLLACLKCR